MAPITQASNESNHQQLLDRLDLYAVRKPFRKQTWKPPQRRNKNVKQIISEASRKEASVLATQNNSGVSTPAPESSQHHSHNQHQPTSGASTNGAATPINGSNSSSGKTDNIAQAAQNLSTFVRERNAQSTLHPGSASATGTGAGPSPAPNAAAVAAASAAVGIPSVTYTNIESAPSLHPSSQRHYCDITGLPAPYTDPKTRLRYHNGEMFGVVRALTQGVTEQYLGARGAHVILK